MQRINNVLLLGKATCDAVVRRGMGFRPLGTLAWPETGIVSVEGGHRYV